jgi:hypothetical protein
MISWATPPPRLPQPPAVAFAVPTQFEENCCVHHTWHATKDAREQPMMARQAMKPPALVTHMMPMMPGTVRRRRDARPFRAPSTSHATPIPRRAMMVNATEVILAVEIWSPERLRVSSSFRTLASGAAAKVDRKVVKNPTHDAWNARMWGLPHFQSGIAVALCSASTGTWNLLSRAASLAWCELEPLISWPSCTLVSRWRSSASPLLHILVGGGPGGEIAEPSAGHVI